MCWFDSVRMVVFLMSSLPLLSVIVFSSILSCRCVAMKRETPEELLVWLLVYNIPCVAILLMIWVCVFSSKCVSCIAQMSRSIIIFCISGYFFLVSPLTFSVEILILCCLWVRRSA